jgi:hypothetical protein
LGRAQGPVKLAEEVGQDLHLEIVPEFQGMATLLERHPRRSQSLAKAL